jgi:tRNA/rRNA methyltransferase
MLALSDEQLANTAIVLVRARNPANIGAVARAMHDFGFPTLRVVNEFPVPFEAAKSAVDASAVLANAASFTTVAEAVADCTLVVGTTAVGERELRHELLTLNEAAPRNSVIPSAAPRSSSAPKKPASPTTSSASATSS